MKCFVSMSLLASAFITYAAEIDLNRDKINRELIILVAKNDIVNQSDTEGSDRDGKNLTEIKEWITKYKKSIDFSYTANGVDTRGMGGPHTALQLACLIPVCSHQVVKLLCESGAAHVKEDGKYFPATHCFRNIRNLYWQYGQYEASHTQYNHQVQKLTHLKVHSLGVPLEVDTDERTSKMIAFLKESFKENKAQNIYLELVRGTTI